MQEKTSGVDNLVNMLLASSKLDVYVNVTIMDTKRGEATRLVELTTKELIAKLVGYRVFPNNELKTNYSLYFIAPNDRLVNHGFNAVFNHTKASDNITVTGQTYDNCDCAKVVDKINAGDVDFLFLERFNLSKWSPNNYNKLLEACILNNTSIIKTVNKKNAYTILDGDLNSIGYKVVHVDDFIHLHLIDMNAHSVSGVRQKNKRHAQKKSRRKNRNR